MGCVLARAHVAFQGSILSPEDEGFGLLEDVLGLLGCFEKSIAESALVGEVQEDIGLVAGFCGHVLPDGDEVGDDDELGAPLGCAGE